MKTLMAVLMLLVSTSLLAVPNEEACEHANTHANLSCDQTVGVVDKVSVPEPSTLAIMGIGLAAIALVRARKRKI